MRVFDCGWLYTAIARQHAISSITGNLRSEREKEKKITWWEQKWREKQQQIFIYAWKATTKTCCKKTKQKNKYLQQMEIKWKWTELERRNIHTRTAEAFKRSKQWNWVVREVEGVESYVQLIYEKQKWKQNKAPLGCSESESRVQFVPILCSLISDIHMHGCCTCIIFIMTQFQLDDGLLERTRIATVSMSCMRSCSTNVFATGHWCSELFTFVCVQWNIFGDICTSASDDAVISLWLKLNANYSCMISTTQFVIRRQSRNSFIILLDYGPWLESPQPTSTL